MKNCLVVLAAAVALASCSADPNSSSVGKAVLTVSPGSVAIRANTTAEIFASAMDPLGGAVSGSYTITNPTPALFTAVIDTGYTPVTSGTRPTTRTRIVVTALQSGDGSFTVTGTGGTVVIPVRIGPDSLTGNIAVSKPTLAEIDTFTATLPTGVRFTAGTSVNVYHQATSADSALFSPVLVGISTDSETATVAVGPNSGGHVRFDGLANVSTPTITYAARGATLMSSPTLDTSGTDVTTALVAHVTLNVTHPLVGDTVTATAPAGWRFTPGTKVHLYKGPTVNDSSDGQAQPVVVGASVDSSTFKFIPGPSGHGQARFTNMVLRSNVAYAYAAVRSIDTLTVAALPSSGAVTFTRADSAANTKVAIKLPAGYLFTAASTATMTGAMAPIVLGVSAAKDTMYVLLPPSTNLAVVFSGITYSVFGGLSFTSTNSVTVKPVADMGNDGPLGVIPTIQLPAKGNYGFWDLGTFDSTDYSPDGGADAQYYRYNLGVAAKINTRVDWNVGNDIDVILLADDGTYSNPVDGFSGASAAAFETSKSGALTVGTYLLDVINYGPFDTGGSTSVGATIRFQLTVF
ncbi:MAG: hypothetical protein WBC97_06315 [Gemmatimonadales bacterium]